MIDSVLWEGFFWISCQNTDQSKSLRFGFFAVRKNETSFKSANTRGTSPLCPASVPSEVISPLWHCFIHVCPSLWSMFSDADITFPVQPQSPLHLCAVRLCHSEGSASCCLIWCLCSSLWRSRQGHRTQMPSCVVETVHSAWQGHEDVQSQCSHMTAVIRPRPFTCSPLSGPSPFSYWTFTIQAGNVRALFCFFRQGYFFSSFTLCNLKVWVCKVSCNCCRLLFRISIPLLSCTEEGKNTLGLLVRIQSFCFKRK